ncbi:hypothetical protein Clacol_007289 [Clathrus columnatus]|uniref:Major facilitator superfamily (MFS) profile domain-containing protein n=1 Tax=Clathrus columnatus TaxID=1419009 RepID=A0AAV5AJJ5_9AGAM|nr:hypothetical protein Clacol_007289 [Clathrus columnatus]
MLQQKTERDYPVDVDEEFKFELSTPVVRQGPDGRPLVPQPSSDPADPLNWSWSWKHIILLQVAIGRFGEIGKQFHVPVNVVSYQVSGHVIGVGIGNLFWTPLSNSYGRRPCYIAAALITLIANIGGSFTTSYAGLMVSRVFQGFGSGAPNTMAAVTIADIFFLHERGAKTGVWIYCTTAGPYLGPIITGFLIQAKDWQWALYLTTIIKAFLFVFMLFFLPETLYARQNSEETQTSSNASDWPKTEQSLHPIRYNLLRNPFKRIGPPATFNEFLRPFKMLRYPSVTLIALPISFGISYSDVGLTSLIPQVFKPLYGFNSQQQGLTFFGFLIGCLIGETLAGKLSDVIVSRRTKANKGIFEPEMRLTAFPLGVFFMATGLLLWGIFVDIPTPWIGPVFVGGEFNLRKETHRERETDHNQGVTICGVQMVTTMGMAYVIDCYSPGPGGSAGPTIIFFCRQVMSLIVPFYNVPVANKIGFTKWFIIQFALIVGSSIGSLMLLWRGKHWRQLYG